MQRISWHWLPVVLLPLLLYLYTMPSSVALEDDGAFIMTSYFNGLSHPPGYPVHSLLGHLFTQIPLGSVAARVHAMSAVFGALACLMLWLTINRLLHSRAAAYAGSLGFAFSQVFWSQSIIAEVYTLHALLLFWLLYMALLICQREPVQNQRQRNEKLFYLFVFVYALALCNHWPLLLLASPGLLLLLWPMLKRKPLLLVYSMPLLVLGLLPYLWMVVNSWSDPQVSFMGPIQSWSQFVAFIGREYYAAIDASSSAGIIDKVYFAGFFLQELLAQFGYAVAALVLLGFITQLRYLPKQVALALLLIFICNSLVLIVLLGFDYSELYRAVIRVFFIVAYAIAAIWLALGARCIMDYAATVLAGRPAAAVASPAIAAATVVIVLVSNFDSNNRRDYHWGDTYARAVLASVPADAVLILDGDVSLGTVGYLHYVEGLRPDLRVLYRKGLLFRDRLFDPYVTPLQEIDEHITRFIRDSKVPVYATSHDNKLLVHHHWLTHSYQPDKHTGAELLYPASLDNDLLTIFFDHDTRDSWTALHRKKLLNQSVGLIVENILRGGQQPLYDDVLKEVLGDLRGMLTFITYVQQRGVVEQFGGLHKLLPLAEQLYRQTADKQDQATYLYFMAGVAQQAGRIQEAESYLLRSIQSWPNTANAAFGSLRELYLAQQRQDDYNRLLAPMGSQLLDRFRIE